MIKELEAYKIIEEEIIGLINDGRTKRIINLYKKQLQIIEQALKRNEPMKPLIDKLDLWDEHKCPVCGNIAWETHVHKDENFCNKCGQKLDWSD